MALDIQIYRIIVKFYVEERFQKVFTTIICISFHIVHHRIEENLILTHTDKHAKCMEAISLFKIIENTELDIIDHLVFIHNCDLTDEKII